MNSYLKNYLSSSLTASHYFLSLVLCNFLLPIVIFHFISIDNLPTGAEGYSLRYIGHLGFFSLLFPLAPCKKFFWLFEIKDRMCCII